MTKKYFLKLAMTLVVAFIFKGVMGQDVADGNYVEIATDVVTYHTAGKTLGFYVLPDAFYNPNYNSAGEWALSSQSGWTWTYSGTGTANATDNYVQITAPGVGNFTITVQETNSLITCDGDEVVETVVILPAPTMEVDAAGAVVFGDQCGALENHEISFNITTEGLANGRVWAQWRLQEFPVIIDLGDGSTSEGAQVGADLVHVWNKGTEAGPVTIEGTEWTMTDNGGFFEGDGTVDPSLAEVTLSMTRNYPLPEGQSAYLYRWVIDPVEGDGVNDRISRKSDYIDNDLVTNPADFSAYGSAGTIDIYIVRAPETGPIYHIPTAFGN